EADEVHAAAVERIPTVAGRSLSIAAEIRLPVVGRDIVLAGNVEDPPRLERSQNLCGGVELPGLRELRDVAGVQHERRSLWQRVQLCDGVLQRADDIGVRLLVEPDVAVADLREEDALLLI